MNPFFRMQTACGTLLGFEPHSRVKKKGRKTNKIPDVFPIKLTQFSSVGPDISARKHARPSNRRESKHRREAGPLTRDQGAEGLDWPLQERANWLAGPWGARINITITGSASRRLLNKPWQVSVCKTSPRTSFPFRTLPPPPPYTHLHTYTYILEVFN